MMTARQYYEARNYGLVIRQAGHRKLQRGFNTEIMATLTLPEKATVAEHRHPANGTVGLLTREKVTPVAVEAAVIVAPAQPAAAPALPQKESLLAFMVRPVLAFLDDISGPAMTARDRDARDLAEARNHWHPSIAGF